MPDPSYPWEQTAWVERFELVVDRREEDLAGTLVVGRLAVG